MKAYVPNILTLLNLLCGCVGIVMTFSSNIIYAAYLIWIAALFDFSDGLAARLLNVKSTVGKELDSLADIVSFGVLPSVIMYVLIENRTQNEVLPFFAFSIVMFSAIRLARFNIDERQVDSFLGLPTPANALFISGLPFILYENFLSLNSILGANALLAISIILSIFMVINMPLLSLKFKSFSVQDNVYRYIFVVISAALLVLMKALAFPIIVLTYIVLSIVSNMHPILK